MKLTIGIPCYNCEKQISRVFAKLSNLKIDQKVEVIFIDNGSTDNTLSTLVHLIHSSNKSNYFIFKNEDNYGLGGTHKVAFNYSIRNDSDRLVILHGDDQAEPNEILELLSLSQASKSTVLGSRFMMKSRRVGYQKTRVFGNIVLNILFSILTLKTTRDLGSGLNVYLVDDIKKVNYLDLTDSFNFNVELLLELYKKKIKIIFSPITWTETDQISNAKNLSVAISMVKSLFLWRIGRRLKNLNGFNYKSKIIPPTE
ncbi:MAG: glycosyltransferase involved in cell wall biosynthesis [Thermoproteota archaeon]|jgi:glycosyltransferase involved in cell wall biosynthesis